MIIANPIYDVVFKYLLEDIEIAREAIASDEIRAKMDVEDEIDRIFEREVKKMAKIIAEKDQELVSERQKVEAERQKAEAERQKAKAERQKNEELLRQIEDLKKQIKK